MRDRADTAQPREDDRLIRNDAIGYLVFGTAIVCALAKIADRIEVLGFFCYVPGVAADNACLPAYFPAWTIPLAYLVGGFLMLYRLMVRNARAASDGAAEAHEKEMALRGTLFGIAGLILAVVSVFATPAFHVCIVWLSMSVCAVAAFCGERILWGAAAVIAALGLLLASPAPLGETVAIVRMGNGALSLPLFVVAFLPLAFPIGAFAGTAIWAPSHTDLKSVERV